MNGFYISEEKQCCIEISDDRVFKSDITPGEKEFFSCVAVETPAIKDDVQFVLNIVR